MTDQHWTEADADRAAKRPGTALIRAHRHDGPTLGQPLTNLLSMGLIDTKPVLDERGRPLSWLVLPTAFGNAVRERSAAAGQATTEERTIGAVAAATEAAFNPRGERKVTAAEIVKTCAALDGFFAELESLPARSFKDWRTAIGDLRIALKSNEGKADGQG